MLPPPIFSQSADRTRKQREDQEGGKGKLGKAKEELRKAYVNKPRVKKAAWAYSHKAE